MSRATRPGRSCPLASERACASAASAGSAAAAVAAPASNRRKSSFTSGLLSDRNARIGTPADAADAAAPSASRTISRARVNERLRCCAPSPSPSRTKNRTDSSSDSARFRLAVSSSSLATAAVNDALVVSARRRVDANDASRFPSVSASSAHARRDAASAATYSPSLINRACSESSTNATRVLDVGVVSDALGSRDRSPPDVNRDNIERDVGLSADVLRGAASTRASGEPSRRRSFAAFPEREKNPRTSRMALVIMSLRFAASFMTWSPS